jgi:hypothetical protein
MNFTPTPSQLEAPTPPPIFDCPRAVYDEAPGMNQSLLKKAEKSMDHLRHAMGGARGESSDAMTLGCIVESLVFGTPFKWAARPDKWDSWRTKDSQQWRKEQEASGVHIVTPETRETAEAMAHEVKNHPEVKRWLAKCRLNIALFGMHEATGEPIKGLLDMAPDDVLVIPDLKTCYDASAREFGKSIAEFGYDVQGAWYQRLWQQNFGEVRKFALIAVESAPPYTPAIHVLQQEDLDKAAKAIDGWMAQYVECKKHDAWSTRAQIPRWRFSDSN